jgi:hypothetical protein
MWHVCNGVHAGVLELLQEGSQKDRQITAVVVVAFLSSTGACRTKLIQWGSPTSS